jgi:hypothetical protein
MKGNYSRGTGVESVAGHQRRLWGTRCRRLGNGTDEPQLLVKAVPKPPADVTGWQMPKGLDPPNGVK